MPSLVVTEQRSTLWSSVRQELAENSVTPSVAGSYFETRTTHAPQPPVTTKNFKKKAKRLASFSP
jgi:hypothetical protein